MCGKFRYFVSLFLSTIFPFHNILWTTYNSEINGCVITSVIFIPIFDYQLFISISFHNILLTTYHSETHGCVESRYFVSLFFDYHLFISISFHNLLFTTYNSETHGCVAIPVILYLYFLTTICSSVYNSTTYYLRHIIQKHMDVWQFPLFCIPTFDFNLSYSISFHNLLFTPNLHTLALLASFIQDNPKYYFTSGRSTNKYLTCRQDMSRPARKPTVWSLRNVST